MGAWAVLVTVLGASASAQDPESPFAAADARLNAAYGAVRSATEPGASTRLRDAQRAWIVYRDAECGRFDPTFEEVCQTSLSNARADVLEREAADTRFFNYDPIDLVAQRDTLNADCDYDGPQFAMNACAARDAADAALALETAVAEARIALAPSFASGELTQGEAESDWARGELSRLATFDRSQAAWARMAEETCQAEGDLHAGGSIAPLIIWSCHAELARARFETVRTRFVCGLEGCPSGYVEGETSAPTHASDVDE